MRRLLLSVFAGLGMTVFAETFPVQLDLEEAERLAMLHSPLLRQAAANVAILESEFGEVRATGLPRLRAEADASYDGNPSSGGGNGDFGGSDNESWRAGLRLDVPLASFGRLDARLEQIEANARSAGWGADRIGRELRLRVRESYLRSKLATEAVRVQQLSVEVLEKQWEDNMSRQEAGSITRLPVLQSRVAYENGRTALMRAERDRKLAIEALRAAIGLPYPEGKGPEDIQLSEDWPAFGLDEMDLNAAREAAALTRPEFLALDEERRAAEAARRLADFSRRPDFGAFATAGLENDRFSDDDTVREAWMLGVQFSVPLYDGGARINRISRAEAGLREIEARRDELWQRIETDLRDAWTELELAEAILESVDVTEEQAEEALRLAREAQANGRATQLEVSTAELDLTRARLERIAAEHDRLRAQSRWLYVIGR
ncbi:MAG: TolC family protein [Verrucomicrobia bacterium]|nr:TolC family protein [Verrucomicrobiota bacterium]MCH8510935.1 TolC family protein [Kiritimatiellia bacterium]